jgi:biotin carboxylase
MATRVLLLGAGGTAGQNFTRALHLAGGYEVVGTDMNAYRLEACGADRTWQLPGCTTEQYPCLVADLVRELTIDFVHAQPDMEVEALVRHADAYYPARTFLPSLTTLRICRNKLETHAILATAGIPVPDSVALDEDGATAIEALAARTGYPVWVRTTVGAGSKGALPVYAARHGVDWVHYWRSSGRLEADGFMACEYLPGAEYAWQSLWRNGELLVSHGRRRVEYLFGNIMPSGQSSTPSVAVSVHNQELNALGQAAVRAIDPRATGIFCLDAKTNRRGRICVTEINAGRFFTTSDFCAAAGCNMPALYVELGMGRLNRVPFPPTDAVPANLWWIRSIDAPPVLRRALAG